MKRLARDLILVSLGFWLNVLLTYTERRVGYVAPGRLHR